MTPVDDTPSVVDAPIGLRANVIRRSLATHMEALSQRTSTLADSLRVWLSERTLRHSILVIDDSAPALCALVSVLARTGVVVHAVTTDASAEAALRGLGAHVHVVSDYARAAGVWIETRSAVVVVDLYLGDGLTGLDVLADIGRGPRAIVVTSCDGARDSIDRAADTIQAESVIRTATGGWESRLRDGVLRLLADASDSGAPA